MGQCVHYEGKDVTDGFINQVSRVHINRHTHTYAHAHTHTHTDTSTHEHQSTQLVLLRLVMLWMLLLVSVCVRVHVSQVDRLLRIGAEETGDTAPPLAFTIVSQPYARHIMPSSFLQRSFHGEIVSCVCLCVMEWPSTVFGMHHLLLPMLYV